MSEYVCVHVQWIRQDLLIDMDERDGIERQQQGMKKDKKTSKTENRFKSKFGKFNQLIFLNY